MTDRIDLNAKHASAPANKTTPRQALMMALNDVSNFEYVVVIMGKAHDGGTVHTRVNVSAPNSYVIAGMIEHALKINLE